MSQIEVPLFPCPPLVVQNPRYRCYRVTFQTVSVGNSVSCIEMGILEWSTRTMSFPEAVEISTKDLHRIHKIYSLLGLVPVCNSGRIVIHQDCMFWSWSRTWNLPNFRFNSRNELFADHIKHFFAQYLSGWEPQITERAGLKMMPGMGFSTLLLHIVANEPPIGPLVMILVC